MERSGNAPRAHEVFYTSLCQTAFNQSQKLKVDQLRMDDKRSKSQAAADERYEAKRASAPRFGGRCSIEEKQLLTRLSEAEGVSEKELIFRALKYFENNR